MPTWVMACKVAFGQAWIQSWNFEALACVKLVEQASRSFSFAAQKWGTASQFWVLVVFQRTCVASMCVDPAVGTSERINVVILFLLTLDNDISNALVSASRQFMSSVASVKDKLSAPRNAQMTRHLSLFSCQKSR